MKKLLAASALAFTAAMPINAQSQAWPCPTIKYIVNFAAAGTTDLLGRMLQPELQKALGVNIVIENHPGAGGNVGAALLAKARPDGCTIGGGTVSSHAINVSLYGAKMPYDPVKDFVHVALIATLPNVLVVNPAVPANNVKELIAYLKANPNKLSFASAGNGTSQHMSGELFKTMTGTEIQHIPYKGSAPGIGAVLSGEVQMMWDNALIAVPHIKAGKLRALGITADKPSGALPGIPTIAEAGGLPGYAITSWQGVFAPAGVPPELVRRLNTEINRILQLPEIREKLVNLGADGGAMSVEQFTNFIKTDITKFAEVVKKSGAKID
jgi:tripartite-type tricarboxylate transporter receptor subunit TctC